MVIRIYLDENVSPVLATFLRLLGYDVVPTAELGNNGATDVAQLLTAVRLDRVMVSHDLGHVGLVHEAWHAYARRWGVAPAPSHPWLLVIPDSRILSNLDAAQEIHQRIGATADEGRLRSWRRPDGWREVV